jgi:hypothetical protein
MNSLKNISEGSTFQFSIILNEDSKSLFKNTELEVSVQENYSDRSLNIEKSGGTWEKIKDIIPL